MQSSLSKYRKIKWRPPNHLDHRFQSKISFIPPPSWSIKDLRLSDTKLDNDERKNDHADDIVSKSTLDVIARRSYIDLDQLPLDHRMRLEKDLRGIMRCISVLVDEENEMAKDLNDLSLTDEDIYDLPRGLNDLTNTALNDSFDPLQTNDKDAEIHDPKYVTDTLQHKLTKATIKSNDEEEDQEGLFFTVATGNKNDDY